MSVLQRELVAYGQRRRELERDHLGAWALFHGDEYVGVFPDFEQAATEAVERFDAGPYLIRQIGVEVIQRTSTMVFRQVHAG